MLKRPRLVPKRSGEGAAVELAVTLGLPVEAELWAGGENKLAMVEITIAPVSRPMREKTRRRGIGGNVFTRYSNSDISNTLRIVRSLPLKKSCRALSMFN
jgi:hypothetical protein